MLIEATIAALEAHGESGVRIEDIQEATGVSRGTIYYHFEDRDALIDAARVLQFTRMVDRDIEAFHRLLDESASREEFVAGVRQITLIGQEPERVVTRLVRMEIVGASRSRPGLASILAREQHRLTDGLTEVITAAQSRGWVRPGLDTRGLSVFVQAFALGRALSDIDEQPVDPSVWVSVVDLFIDMISSSPAD